MTPIITRGSLGVRYLKVGDAPHLLKWLTDPALLSYYEGKDRPYTFEQVFEDFFQMTI